jgi:hypothetical protein
LTKRHQVDAITAMYQHGLAILQHLVAACTTSKCTRCLQHFLHYSDGTDGREPGTSRAKPLDGNLAKENGKDYATRFINWVALNMPGFEYERNAEQLVSRSWSM